MVIPQNLRGKIPFLDAALKRLKPVRPLPTGPVPVSKLPPISSDKERVLIFAPEADVHPHSHAMWISARILKEQGHDVWVTRCHGHLSRCPVMGASRLPFDVDASVKEALCEKCAQHSRLAESEYGLQMLDWRALDLMEIQSRVDEAVSNLPADLAEAKHDGYALGLLASFEVRLGLKISYLDPQDPEIRFAWIQLIQAAIFSYEVVRMLVRTYGFKNVLYFNDYALMLAAGLAAKHEGATPTLVTLAAHRGVDFRRYVLRPLGTYPDYFRIEHEWDTWRDLALPVPLVKEIQEDLMVRFGGQGKNVHIYSTARSVKGVPLPGNGPDGTPRRRLVAYTSSPDEYAGVFALMDGLDARVTTPQLVFGGSVSDCHTLWLQGLLKYVAARPELELVIRIHPREGANKRESRSSSHLVLLQDGLRDLPENAMVIWPEDQVSSYDLAETADVILTSWSTIGVEFARLGMPVLASTRGVSGHPIDTYMQYVDTPEEYFAKLDTLVVAPPSMEALKQSVRMWYAFIIACSVDFSDLVPTPNYWDLPKFRMPREADQFRQVVMDHHSILDLNRDRLRNHASKPGSEEKEEEEIRGQARRFAYYLLSGDDPKKDPLIWYIQAVLSKEDIEVKRKAWGIPKKAVIISGSHWVTCHNGDQVFTKYSPMAARLAFLGAQFSTPTENWRPAVPRSAKVVAHSSI